CTLGLTGRSRLSRVRWLPLLGDSEGGLPQLTVAPASPDELHLSEADRQERKSHQQPDPAGDSGNEVERVTMTERNREEAVLLNQGPKNQTNEKRGEAELEF